MTPHASQPPALLFSISGIRQDNVTGATTLSDSLRQLGIRAGMVVTAQAPEWKLHSDTAALEFIHECASRRHEILLGGIGIPGVASTEAKGEFHRLGQHEAHLRITAAQRQLAAVGLRPQVFAADKWWASEETMEAARRLGLGTGADAYSIRDLQHGIRHNVRVLAFGDGFGAARWWRRSVTRSVQRMSRNQADVRLSINAGKTGHADTARDILGIAEELLNQGYQPRDYADYVAQHHSAVA